MEGRKPEKLGRKPTLISTKQNRRRPSQEKQDNEKDRNERLGFFQRKLNMDWRVRGIHQQESYRGFTIKCFPSTAESLRLRGKN